ncbi:MAG TPA: GTPase Era [Gammaproteobacteria bacterium]|nr:GTPase Era [Gammaproteobacteria bacterium]
MSDAEDFRAGFVAVAGRPNVGKSTLVNALVGDRVAIVSRRPQTTRRCILGVVNRSQAQIVLVDSPGLHDSGGRTLNRALNAGARRAVVDADVVMLVVEAGGWREDDERALRIVRDSGRPAVLVINKVDRVTPREKLLPLIAEHTARHDFVSVIPVSAKRKENLEDIVKVLIPLLPSSPQFFPPDQITDQGAAERASETIREALIERLGAELPYATYVSIESWEIIRDCLHIDAVIWVARDSQKGIVIGAGGRMIKAIGTAARSVLEKELDCRIMLNLRVKVRAGWSEDKRLLGDIGLLP